MIHIAANLQPAAGRPAAGAYTRRVYERERERERFEGSKQGRRGTNEREGEERERARAAAGLRDGRVLRRTQPHPTFDYEP